MPLRATFVTSNPSKAREVRAILRPFGVELSVVRRELAEPQADELETVVRHKLSLVADLSDPVLVEDSGLFVDALGGFPGVYSAYAYRTLGLQRIVRLVPPGRRKARFVTVAGVRARGSSWLVRGEVEGRIASTLRGRGGFGYDPCFVPDGQDRTFAQMTPEEKSRLSHRGRAFAAVGRRLRREWG